MTDKPVISNKQIIAKTKLFCVESMDVTFSNGVQRQYERLARSRATGAVLIVPLIDNETVLLIKEYSAGVDRYELGLPKGKVDPGESVLDASNRELKEEVGYGAKQLHHLSSLSVAPSYLEHMIEIVIAEDLYEEKLLGDEPEELEVIPWKLDNIQGLLATGECTEARSIAALYMVKDYLAEK